MNGLDHKAMQQVFPSPKSGTQAWSVSVRHGDAQGKQCFVCADIFSEIWLYVCV